MTGNWLAGIAAAVVVLGATGAMASGQSQSDAMLFGGEPGEKAYACFIRHYDKAHLAAHPEQNVTDMTLFVDSYVDGELGRQYMLSMGVRFQSVDTDYQLSGGCSSSVDGKKALACGIDCDGGQIDVRVKDANSILVDIPFGARTWDPNASEDAEEVTPEGAQFGPDDKLFRLDRVALKACLPLVWDEEVRATISAAE